MSYTVNAATDTAVRASISTPVASLTFASAVISTADVSSANRSRTSTWVREIGWQSGIRSLVLLAPVIPASFATVRTSPLARELEATRENACGERRTRPVATAERGDGSFRVTSTMDALPAPSTWDRDEVGRRGTVSKKYRRKKDWSHGEKRRASPRLQTMLW